MSIKHLFGAALLCSAFLVSCHKQPEGMQLVAEGFGGSKAAVQGERSYWVDGEMVSINGTDYRVNVADGNAYANDVEEAGSYYALYPNTLASDGATSSANVTVNIPSVYVYRTAGGRQALDLPMAAYGTSNERLVFKHLTAAITVQVVNDFGIDLSVDSIVVTSNEYQISGSRTITLGNDISVDTLTTATAADRRVVVRFNGGTELKVNSGTTAEVQVPVLPVGRRNKFTITVATHNADDAAMKYTFNRTQGSGGALLRAQLGYAPAKFGGVFSVSATKQVRFAPGNLQYQPSTTTWRFAKHQYDIAPFNGSYYAVNSTNWIDMFGFATSGNTRNPYMTSTTDNNYSPGNVYNISKTEDDWGWHNSISNGGRTTHTWRTLTANEWTYLVSRTGSVGKAKVNGNFGFVILPDEFALPSGCSFTTYPGEITTYDTVKWRKMELAGAIFLPYCGYRTGTTLNGKNNGIFESGYYWTSERQSVNKYRGKTLNSFKKTVVGWCAVDSTTLISHGHSVRLVRDVN